MDIDAGNFASVVTMGDDGKIEVDIEVDLEKNDGLEKWKSSEKEMPEATETAERETQNTDSRSEDGPPKLPFSKPRLIGLVVTVTGAAFLNTMYSYDTPSMASWH